MKHPRAWWVGCISTGVTVGASDMLAYDLGHGGLFDVLALYAVVVGTIFALVYIEDYKQTRGVK